ncbi:uncharacterized protein LOC135110058 [Scylla paramamosain]|uniref:uncharacterized protein LOC135110058 n=1 Tax=Scylla paramamosain TaxID=85552 RepID=UPI0030839664
MDFSSAGKCQLYMMSQGLQGPRSLSFALPKDSLLAAKINSVLMRLLDSGIVRKVILDAINNSTECLKPISSVASRERRPLELKDFYGVFSLYAAGMLEGV